MAQGVWADVVYACALGYVFVNHAPHTARGDARALIIQDKRGRIAFCERRVLKKGVAHRKVLHKGVKRWVAEWNNALLATFARDANQLVLEINVAQVQLRQLGNAHARRVKQ